MTTPFLYDIAQNLHHSNRLILRKTLLFETLDKLKRVKVVISLLSCSCVKAATPWQRLQDSGLTIKRARYRWP